MALWHEFRLPITLYLVVILGGGYLYGELYELARGETIAPIDRPFIMMELMILETPGDAPPEWYLVMFWYLLPPIFVFIISLGAADFVHLFFNPNQRRHRWREAVASTYRNHVIVLGAGHVGLRVIRALAAMGREIVVLDHDPDPGVVDVLEELKVPLISDDGRDARVLERAGLHNAESLIICTGNDHVNLEVVMQARYMHEDLRIVVRVWDDQDADKLSRFLGVQAVLSSSDLAAPAFAGAALGIEITQTMRVNGEEYSMIRLVVEPGSFMDGESVGRLQTENDMDIVLFGRGDVSDVQPPHDLAIQAGDTLVIFARHDKILEVVAHNRPTKKRRIH